MIRLSASFNPCPEDQALLYAKQLQDLNADYLHCDVMRDNFVDHNALHLSTIADIYNSTLIPLDIHLMVKNPQQSLLKDVIKIKPNYITVHYEAFDTKKDMVSVLKQIRKAHILAGLAINPTTFVKDITEFLPYVDMVVVMGVNPGKSGQKLISNTFPKVKELRSIIYEYRYDIKIEVDGGLNQDNMQLAFDAGADVLVFGSKLYDAHNRKKFISDVHNLK